MRRFSVLSFGAILAVVAAVGVAADKETPDESMPRFIAVKFHADTCAKCKEMDGKYLTKLRAEFADQDILFLTADLTSRGSRHQSKLLLNSLNLDGLWAKYGKSSGNLIVLNVDTGDQVHAFGAKDDLATVKKALGETLSGGGDDADEEEPMDEEEDEGCYGEEDEG